MVIDIKYNQQEDEKKEQEKWFNSEVYRWDKNLPAELDFIIDTPPPTVSGYLHMGHVFSYCQTDFIARYQRMCGKNVFYPIGFDDNGLPTERLVEKIHKVKGSWMNKNGKKQEFIKMCHDVINEAETEFEKLFKTLGISYDWLQKYQTISESTQNFVIDTFNKLKDAELIYKKDGPVYWDVVDQTALAQSIIEDKNIQSSEYYLVWNVFEKNGEKLNGQKCNAIVMTTRPELLPACVAVFYNPNDERYKYLKDKTMQFMNITDRVVCLSDDSVKMDKGTGLVMCCTYGDWQDVEWTRKYNLKHKIIVDKEGKFNKTDLKANKAREFIIEQIKNDKNYNGNIKDVKQITHVVKVGERSKEPVEIIDSNQWYVKTLKFKDDLLTISKYINFHPKHLKNRLIQWIEGLNQDWCISRDRFFGINIPDKEFQQVFDTWFTSSSSTFICREGERIRQKKNNDDERFTKTVSLRPQAHEIIRTWTFSTILKTYLMALIKNNLLEEREKNKDRINEWLEKDLGEEFIVKNLIPWNDVMLSGWCLAKDGTKMSKSAGNVITPTNLIKEKGSDIVRYWAGSCSLGVDTAFNETKFLDGKKLVNKLINATKFALMHFEREKLHTKSFSFCLENIKNSADKWIVSLLKKSIEQYKKNFDNFEYSTAKNVIERFFFDQYCDNYLELIKFRAYENDLSALSTLRVLSESFLLLFAPFIPHLCGNIYDKIFEKDLNRRGAFDILFKENNINLFEDEQAEKDMKIGLEIINFVRQKKAELNISIKSPISKLTLKEIPKGIENDIKNMLNINVIEIGDEFEMEV